MGNPHLVVALDGADEPQAWPLEALANAAVEGPWFPRGVNVEMTRMVGADQVEARVFERGVGETRACGSGACAIAVALIAGAGAPSPLWIRMPGGTLEVTWDGDEAHGVLLSGPAQQISSGKLIW
jgi:diaminopimelate epimerase